MDYDLKFSISFEVTGKNVEDFFDERPECIKKMYDVFYDEVYEYFKESVYEELRKLVKGTSLERQNLYSSIKMMEINFLSNLKINIFYFVIKDFITNGNLITNGNILRFICKEFIIQILETYKYFHTDYIIDQLNNDEINKYCEKTKDILN